MGLDHPAAVMAGRGGTRPLVHEDHHADGARATSEPAGLKTGRHQLHVPMYRQRSMSVVYEGQPERLRQRIVLYG